MTSTQPAIGSGTLIRFVQTWSLQYQLLHISHSSCLPTQTLAFWPGIPLVRLQPWIARCVRLNQSMSQALWFAVLNLKPTISSLHFSNSSCPRTNLTQDQKPRCEILSLDTFEAVAIRHRIISVHGILTDGSRTKSYRQKRPLNISSMALREIVALGAGAYTSRIMAVA